MSKNTGLSSLAADDFSIIEAIGGVRGIIEAIVPFLTFMIAYMASSNLGLSLIIVVVELVAIVVARLIQRQTLIGAFSGMVVTVISVVFAAMRGSARDFYSPGIWINTIFLCALLLSILVGKPAIGWLLDTLTSRKTLPVMKKEYVWATVCWAALFVIRLGAEVPLYVTHHVSALGVVRIVTGIPLFAVALLVSWAIIAPARKKKAKQIDELNTENTHISPTDGE